MDHLRKILKEIEVLRYDLHKKADETGINDPEVIAASQMLNALLDEYYRLISKKIK